MAIHSQRCAGCNLRFIRDAQKDGAERAHLGFEQSMCITEVFALEGVRANELREAIRLMRGRLTHGPHLDERHMMSTLRQLPRRLAAGEARAYDQHFSAS